MHIDSHCTSCSGHGHSLPLEPACTHQHIPGEEVISLQDVSFGYDDQEVLTQVNLTVHRGDFMAVIGPNGGGKTTLIKLILGLLSPGSGAVRVLGQNPLQHRPAIGYVPQHAAVQPRFPITVRDVVLLGLRRAGRSWPGYSAADKRTAVDILAQVDMADLAQRRFDALSGGQKQRVLVARARIAAPCLLLFDEPTANIDPQGKICLFDLLSSLSQTITILMVSHDLISASTRITSVAAVNRRLIQNTGRELTHAMLALIYGTHDASCPLDEYIKGLPSILHP